MCFYFQDFSDMSEKSPIEGYAMAFQDALRRVQAAHERSASDYFADQQRRLTARAVDPSISDLETLPDRQVIDGRTMIAQPAMRAVVRPSIEPWAEPAPRQISDQNPAPYPTAPAPESLGAPLSMTLEDFRRLDPEARQRAIARLLAVDGARTRMAPVPGRTLTQALERELDYQRGLLRKSAQAVRDGRTHRVSKTKPKADAKKGYRKMKQGGTASFRRGTPYRVAVHLFTWAPPREGEVSVIKLRAIDRTLLESNATQK